MLELLWIKSLLHFLSMAVCLFLWNHLNHLAKSKAPHLLHLRRFLLVKCSSDLIGFLYFTIWIREAIPGLPTLYHAEIILQLAMGPLLLFFARAAKEKPASTNQFIHFLPGLILGAIYMLQSNPGPLFKSTTFLFAQAHFVVYALAVMNLWKGSGFNTSIKLFRVFVIGLIFWKGLRFVEYGIWEVLGMITEPWAWVLYCISEMAFIGMLVYLLSQSTQKTRLFDLNSNGWSLSKPAMLDLEKSLKDLMEVGRIYMDPLVNVKRVSKKLNVAPHHLSQFLNKHLNTTFNELINFHRIEESKKRLGNPENTVQDVFYGVGFNSKSVFNTAFKKHTGVTPSVYRKSLNHSDNRTLD